MDRAACRSLRDRPVAPAASARPVDLTRPLRALVVGGGPTRTANQVAIESNVRYFGRILPYWPCKDVVVLPFELEKYSSCTATVVRVRIVGDLLRQ